MEEKSNFAFVAIVAIVAIVALVVLISDIKTYKFSTSEKENLIGQYGSWIALRQPSDSASTCALDKTNKCTGTCAEGTCTETVGNDGESICRCVKTKT